MNTVLALLTSTVTTFGLTQILQDGKIGTQAVQNATLAGAVAVGATAGFLGPSKAQPKKRWHRAQVWRRGSGHDGRRLAGL